MANGKVAQETNTLAWTGERWMDEWSKKKKNVRSHGELFPFLKERQTK